MHVVANADLAGHHDVIAGRRAAGDSDLRTNHVVPADAAVVGDHHQVVDLGAVADFGRAVGAPIDRRQAPISTSSPISTLPNWAQGSCLAVDQPIAKAVRADHATGMDHGPRADRPFLVQHDVRIERDFFAQPAAGHDVAAAVNRGSAADHHVVADGGPGMNVDVVADPGRRADKRSRADADPPAVAAAGTEMLHDPGEGLMNVGHGDGGHRQPVGRKAGRNDRGPGLGGGQFFGLFVPIDKGDVARPGVE